MVLLHYEREGPLCRSNKQTVIQVMITISRKGLVNKVLYIYRIIKSAEFGLYEKWIEMSKQQYFKWRLVVKNSGLKDLVG